jgi:hypothetical protein
MEPMATGAVRRGFTFMVSLNEQDERRSRQGAPKASGRIAPPADRTVSRSFRSQGSPAGAGPRAARPPASWQRWTGGGNPRPLRRMPRRDLAGPRPAGLRLQRTGSRSGGPFATGPVGRPAPRRPARAPGACRRAFDRGGDGLCLASRFPKRVLSMTLLSPFCRPTPHRWKLGLRIAVAPVVGPLVRPAVPHLLSITREHFLARLSAPNRPPETLRRLPLGHLAKSGSLLTLAAELKAFNEDIARADPRVPSTVPVVAVFAADDTTADPRWHSPWLRDRVARLDLRTCHGVGHMLHHACPDLAWKAVQDAIQVGKQASAPVTVSGRCSLPQDPRA